ncbi:metallophosphoesterase [Microbulbifer magnicolonia]|uniref:metallophosphoesterase n=1 Tax=Microbulbifer magnicolonia TaxID=3109744 RepID=UPI002B41523E|nr:metallophosphoesterase [Microbulbifer sp. GG15]
MTILRRVGRNLNGRDYVVGDVHGHLSQLRRQLGDIRFDPYVDRLFFLGDVVDRGPDSEGVLAMIDQRTYFSILGNHEAMMIAGFEERGEALLHQMNGGDWFYELPEDRQRRIVDQVRTWPWAMEIDVGQKCAGLVHGNVPDSSWHAVVEYLQGAEAGWKAGASLAEPLLDRAAKPLLWDRTLVTRLYRDFLEREARQLEIAEQLQSRPQGQEWVVRGAPEQLRPFQVSGIDAVYMGHTYVPTATQVGRCHFLDTYREEPGEVLSIICINAQAQASAKRR